MKSKLRGVKHRIEEATLSCSDNSFTGLPPQMSADQRADAEQQARNQPGRFRGTCSLSTWLTRVAINSALMVLRKRRARLEMSFNRTARLIWDRGIVGIPSSHAESRTFLPRTRTEVLLRGAILSVGRGATRLLLRCITQKSARQTK